MYLPLIILRELSIATYQDLGYIRDNYLTIISPVKRVKQFVLKPNQILIMKFTMMKYQQKNK